MKEVNLLPEQYMQAEKKRLVKKVSLIFLGGTLFIVIFCHFILQVMVNRLEWTASNPFGQQETPEFIRLRQSIDAQRAGLDTFVNQNKDIIEIALKQDSVSLILSEIGNATTDKVWLTSLSVDLNEGICALAGKSLSTRLVSEFMLELKKAPYFVNINLITMGKETQEINFQLTLNLK